jgi:acetyl esterase/lipase
MNYLRYCRDLQEAGADVRYTEYPGVAHSPTFKKAWQEADILDWLFAKWKE